MQFIQGSNRHQSYFSTLDEQVGADNAVRLIDGDLLGKTTIGIDGSKFKAVNRRKNNYNQKKIDKHQQFIADKTAKYLQELDELDKQESNTGNDELQIKKEKITQDLAEEFAEMQKLKYF